MGEAATELAPEPLCTDDLLRQAIDELRACRARVEEDIARRGPLTELMAGWHRLADLQDQLRQVAMQQTLAEVLAAVEPEPEAVPRRRARAFRQQGRHAATGPLRVLPSGALLPAAAAFRSLRFPSWHALAAHKAVLLTAGAGSALAASAVVGMHAAHTLPFDTSTGPGSWHAPAAIAWDADPVPSPSSPMPVIYPGPQPPPGKHHKPVPAVTLTVTPPPQVPSSSPSDSWGSSSPSLSPDSSPSSDSSGGSGYSDGSGDGGGQQQADGSSQDSGGTTDTGRHSRDGSGNQDGGTGRHRGQDQGDGGWQHGDQSGQYQGRHDGGSGDGGGGWQGGDGQQGGNGHGQGNDGQQGNHGRH